MVFHFLKFTHAHTHTHRGTQKMHTMKLLTYLFCVILMQVWLLIWHSWELKPNASLYFSQQSSQISLGAIRSHRNMDWSRLSAELCCSPSHTSILHTGLCMWVYAEQSRSPQVMYCPKGLDFACAAHLKSLPISCKWQENREYRIIQE